MNVVNERTKPENYNLVRSFIRLEDTVIRKKEVFVRIVLIIWCAYNIIIHLSFHFL